MANRNEYFNDRVAKANFAISSYSTTGNLTSGVYLPAGALVTGVTVFATASGDANHTADSATAVLAICNTALSSTQSIASAFTLKQFSQTVAYVPTLSVASGFYVPVSGELIMILGSATTAHSMAPDVYVGYIPTA